MDGLSRDRHSAGKDTEDDDTMLCFPSIYTVLQKHPKRALLGIMRTAGLTSKHRREPQTPKSHVTDAQTQAILV